MERRRRKNELAAVLAEKEILQQFNKDELKQAIKIIRVLGQQEYHCRILAETNPIVVNHRKKAQ